MPGQIGTSIRANTRKIHSGDRESDAIDAAGLARVRERFALLGRDVSQLSDDQLRNLVAELERRFCDEALPPRVIWEQRSGSTPALALAPASSAHFCSASRSTSSAERRNSPPGR
jgi:hypothetical protein